MGGIFRRRPHRIKRKRFIGSSPAGGGGPFTIPIGQAQETGKAVRFPLFIGQATENGQAGAFSIPAGVEITEAGRLVWGPSKLDERGNRVSGVVTERGERIVTGVRATTEKTVIIGQAFEADEAGLFAYPRKIEETDAASSITPVHVVVMGQATETGTAQQFSGTIFRTYEIGKVVELDEAADFAAGTLFQKIIETDYVINIVPYKYAPNRGSIEISDSQADILRVSDTYASTVLVSTE